MPLCVYAIIRRRLSSRALLKVRRADVRQVTAGGVSAVVADCKTPPLPSARALRGHDAMVRRIARAAPAILPARFGTAVSSERALVALLRTWSKDLSKALALVDRREQMTLRVFARTRRAGEGEGAREGRPAEAGAAGGTGEAGGKGPGASYLLRRAVELGTAEAPELEPLRHAFASLVAAERIARHDRGPLVLTAYHLIPRGAATAYRSLLRRHAAALDHRAVSSGPWPPYAFVPELRR